MSSVARREHSCGLISQHGDLAVRPDLLRPARSRVPDQFRERQVAVSTPLALAAPGWKIWAGARPGLEKLKVDPAFDALCNEPRFQAIERALKFPD
jgi:hypothetical protein